MHLLGSGFGAFLLLCAGSALLLAGVVIGGVIAIVMLGDARMASRRKPQADRLSTVGGARLGSTITVARPAHKVALTILYASETGNAEGLACAAGQAATRLGLASRVMDMADTTPFEAAKAENLMVIASTWGEGEPPQRATDFYETLMSLDAPRFDGESFAVLALGDRAYANLDNFCETGRRLDARLAQLGGTRTTAHMECDADYELQATAWIGARLAELAPSSEVAKSAAALGGPSSVVQVNVAHPAEADVSSASREHPFSAEITEKINLNTGHSGIRTFHVALALASIAYEPGDSLGVMPENDPALVEEMLNVVGLGGSADLREAMGTRYDITTLTLPQVVSYAAMSGDKALADIAAAAGCATAFLGGGRQLIDLLTAAPRALTARQFTGLLRRLQPRLYSIASSRKAAPDEAHLLIAAVEYEAHGRAREGVASMEVAERRQVGERLRVYLKPNPHFRLPTDPAQRVVMIGPGTGVAPFRAFMQERSAIGATGKNWLFFGNRRCADDFLYQLEWQDLCKRGVLNRLNVAFSRDQPEKIYVQNRMWETRHDLYAWLQDGAALYVCGNAGAMARDVNAMLIRIAADQGSLDEVDAQAWLDELRRGGRYLRDVY